MAAHAFLNLQEEVGKQTLQLLDAAGLDIRAAYWVLDEDSQRWRFVVAEPTFDREGPHALYEKIGQALQGQRTTLPLRDIFAVSPDDALIALVRIAVSTPGDAVMGIWFTGNVIKGTNVPDMYIYRMYRSPVRP